MLLLLSQFYPRRHSLHWTGLLRRDALQERLGLLLELHGELTDLLLVGLLLVLLSDDLVHHLLHKTTPADPRLVGLDHDLLAGLQRLLCPDLDQVSSAVMLNYLGLDDLLALLARPGLRPRRR